MTTIKEIAQQLNVSASTISRALNGKKGVSETLRRQVIKLSEKLGYYPDSNATALVKKRVGVLAVVIPRDSDFVFTTPFFPRILLGINRAANNAGYNILLSTGADKDFSSLYHRKLVDGLLVVGHRIDDRNVLNLEHSGIPNVVVPGFPDKKGPDLISVDGENIQSVKRAVSYLCSMGHHKIAVITGASNSKYSIERLRGFRQGMADANIEINEQYLLESDFSVADGSRMMAILLQMKDRPTAVMAINDAVAMGAIQEIERWGLKIPQDISLLAVGGSDVLDGINPPVTSIKIPTIQIGEKAVELLIAQIEGKPIQKRKIVFPTDLIVRESTGICKPE